MLNWLHLTDLHWGLSGQLTLFPNLKDKFIEDLKSLLEKSGSWDLIFFTGDLVQSGKKVEFDDLETNFLAPFGEDLKKMLGYRPVMLAIPGNHDLDRKELERFPATTRSLLDSNEFSKISGQLFSAPENGKTPECRLAIEAAFENYNTWWDEHKPRVGDVIERLTVDGFHDGLMPGDFSATFKFQSDEGPERKVGIIGLNTTFLQLAAGDFRGKLSWDPRQLNAVCDGDAPAWVKRHDACLLLTHQGPEWLTPEARREAMYEINPPGRFAVHLFGHEHELLIESQATLGGPLQNTWQGASLFGLEAYGEGPARMVRRHGFSAGRLDLDQAELRIWPRKAVLIRGTGWQFVPDREGCVLSEDDSLRQTISQVSNSNWMVMDLDRAQVDLTREMMKFGPQDEIILHHLGLDMTEAKNRLIVMLRENLRAKRMSIQLLVLSEVRDDYPKGSGTPPDVLTWAKDAPGAVKHIKDEINKLKPKYEKQLRQLTLTTRAYAEVPTIHGFSLKKKHKDDVELVATYFAFCRWRVDLKTYEWGESRYWKISRDRRDRLSEDMSAIFEGSFKHLWEESKNKESEPVRIGPTEPESKANKDRRGK